MGGLGGGGGLIGGWEGRQPRWGVGGAVQMSLVDMAVLAPMPCPMGLSSIFFPPIGFADERGGGGNQDGANRHSPSPPSLQPSYIWSFIAYSHVTLPPNIELAGSDLAAKRTALRSRLCTVCSMFFSFLLDIFIKTRDSKVKKSFLYLVLPFPL